MRLKDASTEELIDRGAPFRLLSEQMNVTFVVNDDVQAALALLADGVHLGREDEGMDLPRGRDARRLLRVHTREEASQAEEDGATYIGAGPVWSTPSKPDSEPIGLEGLRDISDVFASP